MGRVLIEALLCGLPIILFFISLSQISSWKLGLFRWGIVVTEFSESCPVKIPEHLTNKIIEHKGITFKFVSQKQGLFLATIIGRWTRHPSTYSSSLSITPLLGEINLDKAGVAKITLRIPNSIILLALCILLALIGFTILSKDVADPSSTMMGILVITIFLAISIFMEKTQLSVGIQKIKEYILENT